MSSSSSPQKNPGVSITHAADEAGGEVVFSSDGLDPLPVPLPPPTPRFQSHHGEKDEFILTEDESLMGVDQALQAFQSAGQFRQYQSPEERLQRLEQELQIVSKELTAPDTLQQQVSQLRSRLEKQLQELQRKPIHQQSLNATDATTSTNQDAVITQDLEQVMRRLERAIGTMSISSSSSGSNSTTVANTAATPARGKGLLDRIATLEHVVEQLDERKLELAVRQAKVLRSDLQAASKARSKLLPLGATGSASAPPQASGAKDSNYHNDDAKTISLLFNTMNELQDIRQHLPAITLRLQALAQLHTDASTYRQRLAAVEQSLTALSSQVTSAEESVKSLQNNWTVSIEPTMRSNLQAIDERIARVREMK